MNVSPCKAQERIFVPCRPLDLVSYRSARDLTSTQLLIRNYRLVARNKNPTDENTSIYHVTCIYHAPMIFNPVFCHGKVTEISART